MDVTIFFLLPMMLTFFGDKSHDSVEKYFGKLSWLSLPDTGSDSSYCATFRTQDWFRREEFQEVPSLPTPRLDRPSWDKESLGNLRGSLCLLDSTSGFDCVVWLMKDYGVADSWMKQHVISQSINPGVPVSFTLVGVLRTGDMLLLGDSSYMVLYDPTTKTTDETGPHCLGEDEVKFDVFFHVPSLVSLQDIVEPTNRNHKSKMEVWYGKLHPISTNRSEELKMKQKVEDLDETKDFDGK